MDVILLTKVPNLGVMGDRVSVRPGYARNFLLPKGKATATTPANVAKFEARRAELEAQAEKQLKEAQGRAEKVKDIKLRITSKAGTEGKLFGSIGTSDIVDACAAQGLKVERSEVRMPNGPIRTVGEHVINLHLHTDVDLELPLTVVAEE